MLGKNITTNYDAERNHHYKLTLKFKDVYKRQDLSVLSDRRYQGWFAGGGIAYGYAWILNKRWNLEAELVLGWIYTRYDLSLIHICIKNAGIVIICCFIVAVCIFQFLLGNPSNFMNNDPNNHPLNLLGTIYKGGVIVPVIQTLLLTVLALSCLLYTSL